MEVSSLLKPNTTQELINTMIRSMLFAAYADVMEVKEDYVVVQGSVCENLMPFTASAKVIYPTTSQVQVAFMPKVGDKVLVVGLQAYNDEMFTSTVPVINTEDTRVEHYTLLGCVAIPLNIKNDDKPLRISDGDFKIEGTDAHGITINEGDDPVVRWSELASVLNKLWTAYNGHSHPGEGSDPPTNLWIPDSDGTFTDLASDVLAVPKASTGGA